MLPWLMKKDAVTSIVDARTHKQEPQASNLDSQLEAVCDLMIQAIQERSPQALRLALVKAHDIMHEQMEQEPHDEVGEY